MRKLAIALALVAVTALSSSVARAQKAAPNVASVISAPDLSKLNINQLIQELGTLKPSSFNAATAAASESSADVTPGQVIVEFLQLTPGQIAELQHLIQSRQSALVPLLQQAQALSSQLEALLNSGSNPAQVGLTALQFHSTQMQIFQVQQAFLTQFTATLAADQLQRLQAVQIAAQLQPILPAFHLIFLI